jgi:hypothetical protein
VGGGAGDAPLDLGAGPALVSFGSAPAVTFAVTALPADGAFAPDLVGSAQLNTSLILSTTRLRTVPSSPSSPSRWEDRAQNPVCEGLPAPD